MYYNFELSQLEKVSQYVNNSTKAMKYFLRNQIICETKTFYQH